MKYRPEIDGLRTIAVLAVIIALPVFLEALYAEKPNIIVASAAPTFNGAQKPKTLFDEILLSTPDRPAQDIFGTLINKQYYTSLNPASAKRSAVIEEIAKGKGVKYVSKAEVVCELQLQQCFGVTPDGYKAFYDQGHWTVEDAKYFGERMFEKKWLNMDH